MAIRYILEWKYKDKKNEGLSLVDLAWDTFNFLKLRKKLSPMFTSDKKVVRFYYVVSKVH